MRLLISCFFVLQPLAPQRSRPHVHVHVHNLVYLFLFFPFFQFPLPRPPSWSFLLGFNCLICFIPRNHTLQHQRQTERTETYLTKYTLNLLCMISTYYNSYYNIISMENGDAPCYFHEGDPRLSVFTLDSEDQLRWSSPTLTQSEPNTPGPINSYVGPTQTYGHVNVLPIWKMALSISAVHQRLWRDWEREGLLEPESSEGETHQLGLVTESREKRGGGSVPGNCGR